MAFKLLYFQQYTVVGGVWQRNPNKYTERKNPGK